MKKSIFLVIFAILTLAASCAYAYSDVNEGDWFYENVTEMSENGYLKGYED